MFIEIITSVFINLLMSYLHYDYEHMKICNNNVILLKNEISELYSQISDLHTEINDLKMMIETRDDDIQNFINSNYMV